MSNEIKYDSLAERSVAYLFEPLIWISKQFGFGFPIHNFTMRCFLACFLFARRISGNPEIGAGYDEEVKDTKD